MDDYFVQIIDNNPYIYNIITEYPPKIKTVYSNYFSFAALDNSGTLYCWGNERYGGDSSGNISNVYKVVSSEKAFTALLYDDQTGQIGYTIMSWGEKEYGGDLYDSIYGMKYYDENTDSIVHIDSSNEIIALGPFKNVFSNQYSFIAQTYNNNIYCWGHPKYGGNIFDVSYGLSPYIYKHLQINTVTSTYDHYIAIDIHNTTHIWGNKEQGATFQLCTLKEYSDISYSEITNENDDVVQELNLNILNVITSFVYEENKIKHIFRNTEITNNMVNNDIFDIVQSVGVHPQFLLQFSNGKAVYSTFDLYDNVSFVELDISYVSNIYYFEETITTPNTFLLETSNNEH